MRALLRGNLLWLSVVSLLNDAASEMIYPLLPVFVARTLGGGASFLGLLEGVAESTSSLLKLASGWLSDRGGRRKPLVAGGYALAAATRPLIGLATAPWQVLAVRFGDRIGKGMRSAPRDALLAASVPAAGRATAFSVHRAADHLGAAVGPLIATGVLLLWPGDLRRVFLWAAVPGVATVLVVLFRVHDLEPAPAKAATPSVSGGAGPPLPALAALGPGFRRYLAVLALFTLGNASDAFLLLRAEQLGISVALLPMLWAALHLSKVVWSVPGGRLADRLGPKPAIVAGWLVYAAVYAGFAVADLAWHAWALFATYGLFFGLTEGPEKALVAALAPENRRGSAFGAFHLVVGVAALPASLAFGLIWDQFGAQAAFALGATLALTAATLLPLTLPSAQSRAA